jgi:hypothetical protein
MKRGQFLESLIREIVADELRAIEAERGTLPDLLEVKDVAKRLGVGPDTVYELVKGSPANGFPFVKLSAQNIRIDARRLASWLASGGLAGEHQDADVRPFSVVRSG